MDKLDPPMAIQKKAHCRVIGEHLDKILKHSKQNFILLMMTPKCNNA